MIQYNETISFLYGLQKHGIKLGLDNISQLMSQLGQPHRSFRSVHIAGTNGKGSVASAIASVLHENGFRTGLFTSPHLVSFTERIRINDQQISETDVVSFTAKIREIIAGAEVNPTFFEFVTALAFYYFATNGIDWAVVETGMGGRLDATNVIHPEVTVVTNVGQDHREYLGDTIREITFEKAGIIKPGVPLVTAAGNPDVLEQLSQIASERGVEIHQYGKDFAGTLVQMNEDNTVFDYTGYSRYPNLSFPLAGQYQMRNACSAVRVFELLKKKQVPLKDDALRAGLQHTQVQGRFDRVSDNPLIILDGAHNADAARALTSTVTALFPHKNIIFVAGIMRDKDIRGIMVPLIGIAQCLILTRPAYDRSASVETLKDTATAILADSKPQMTPSILTSGSVKEALDMARRLYTKDHVIVVTGSFYTIGEAREIMGSKGVLSTLRE